MASTLPAGKYIFYIGEENDQYFNKGMAIYITPADYWEENRVIADHYIEEEQEELNPVLDEIGLAEVMQSTYESTNITNEDKLRAKMLIAGFIEDALFSEYVESFKSSMLTGGIDEDDDINYRDDDTSYLETYEE